MIIIRKDIYKITNTINGKVYIGQSVDPEGRFKEHYYGKNNGQNSPIHNAMQKYKIDSFTLEILEHNIENYNEMERYWIEHYNSTDRKYGYNVAPGGEDPPIMRGEQSILCKLSDEDIGKICTDIRDTNDTYVDIAKRYGISAEYVQLINKGKSRRVDGFTYPIRRCHSQLMSQNIVLSVIEYLENTSVNIEEISRIHGIDSNTVYLINSGEHKNAPQGRFYPIRASFKRISADMVRNIRSDMADNKMKMSEIENLYNISHTLASRINQGRAYRDESIDYPIRKSSQRVY